MTAQELRNYFNNTYGINEPWPKTFDVDADTYAQICQEVFNHVVGANNYKLDKNYGPFYPIALGPNNGILFKTVELILRKE